MPNQKPDKPSGTRGRLIAIVLYIVLSIGLYFVLAPFMSDQNLQAMIEKGGTGGILLYIGLYAAQIFVPWLPGVPLDIIGGAVFGFWLTTFLSSLSAALSGIVIYIVVRRIGLKKIVEQFPALLESPWRLVKIIKMRPWALAAVNMLTGDVAYFVAGAAETPAVFSIVLLGVMRIPNVMLGAAIGAGLLSEVLQQRLDIMVTVASIGTIIALSIGFLIVRKFLPIWLERLEATAANEQADQDAG